MRMIELSGVKGGAVWVNPEQVLYVGLPEGPGSSMYGDNNNRTGTRLFFAQGGHLEVREAIEEVVARMTGAKAAVAVP